jgi:CRISPR system Cascade subunit CasB
MPSKSATAFVDYIVACSTDRGSRAALRSGLGRTVNDATRMHAYLAPWSNSERPHEETVRYTVAALIAHNTDSAIPSEPAGNIGTSIARCSKLAPATREKTVHLLARQSAAQLCRMLTGVVVQVRNTGTPVDFAQLLDDVTYWPWRHKDTSRQWLQSYYRNVTANEPDTPA